MNYRILFFLIAMTIVVMGSIMFFVVSQGANKTRNAVLSENDGRTLTSPDITKTIWYTGEPAFSSTTHTCESPFLNQVYINVNMRYREVPRSCEFFMNDKYVLGERNLRPECIGECPVGEFSRTFALGYADVRDRHTIKVCCNDICIERNIQPLCEITSSGELVPVSS